MRSRLFVSNNKTIGKSEKVRKLLRPNLSRWLSKAQRYCYERWTPQGLEHRRSRKDYDPLDDELVLIEKLAALVRKGPTFNWEMKSFNPRGRPGKRWVTKQARARLRKAKVSADVADELLEAFQLTTNPRT